jgi:hypothetical protein
MVGPLCAGDKARGAVDYLEVDHGKIHRDIRRRHIVAGYLSKRILEEIPEIRMQALNLGARRCTSLLPSSVEMSVRYRLMDLRSSEARALSRVLAELNV